MIVSKASLQLSALAKKDTTVPQLENIKVESDGTVVAANRNTVIAMSPVPDEAKRNLPTRESEPCEGMIPRDLAQRAMTAIGRDRMFGGRLEFADVSKERGDIKFKVVDEKNKTATLEDEEPRGEWVPWRQIITEHGKTIGTFILNRSRLHILLDILDRAAPDSGGETPVYLEFTEDNYLVIRARNYITGQDVFGVMMSYKGAQLEQSEWEEGIRAGKTISTRERRREPRRTPRTREVGSSRTPRRSRRR